MRIPNRVLQIAAIACVLPGISHAHSFGVSYVLPVPFWIYLYGCAATLVVTFAILGYFLGVPASSAVSASPCLGSRPPDSSHPISRAIVRVLQAGAVGSLLLTILSGLIGSDDPSNNIGMTLFWVVLLLGLTYASVFVGDVYGVVNPWRHVVSGVARAGINLSVARLTYPRWLQSWPAVALYAGWIWCELFVGRTPLALSIALFAYGAITLLGSFIFGQRMWFMKADFFSVFFRLVANLAPIAYLQRGPGEWRFKFRRPFTAALSERPEDMSTVLFVLFMLSSTSYDGIFETDLWIGLYWRNLLWLLQPVWGTDLAKAQDLLMSAYLVYRQVGLLVFPFIFLAPYTLALLCTKWLTRTSIPLRTLTLAFCYSLIPIAVAYSFTHYFTFLLSQASNLTWLAVDPFGFGWHVPVIRRSTGQFMLPMGLVWHIQVAVLLGGHVISVYLAHLVALRTFSTRREVIISQIPMLILMVGYTMFGLSILSLPTGPSAG